MDERADIAEFNYNELADRLSLFGEPAYRASQIYSWIHKRGAVSFDEMSDVPKDLRAKLRDSFYITEVSALSILKSGTLGTGKYVFKLRDGNIIESVLMRYRYGYSVCVSSQAGCDMGCRFCASAIGGCARNLSAAEILAEVYRIERDIGERVTNVVIMGSGEPLVNYAEVVRFIRMLTDKNGHNLSARSVTLSTSGIPDKIRQLADEDLRITLSLSLHAADPLLRKELMPVAGKFDINEVLDACRYYYDRTGRRVSFEYVLIKGLNDSESDADMLIKLLKVMGEKSRGGKEGAYHVNLIPVNPVAERHYFCPDRDTVRKFRNILLGSGASVTVRRGMGRDIDSACGQLRRRYIENAGSVSDRYRS